MLRGFCYEAGALSKTIDDKTRLCIYLLGGLQFQDVEPPLGMFQATNADKDDTLRLIKTINKAVTEDPVPEKALEALFELTWPELEQKILTMPKPNVAVPAKRDLTEVVAEILEIARSEVERGSAVVDQLNYIEELVKSQDQGNWHFSPGVRGFKGVLSELGGLPLPTNVTLGPIADAPIEARLEPTPSSNQPQGAPPLPSSPGRKMHAPGPRSRTGHTRKHVSPSPKAKPE